MAELTTNQKSLVGYMTKSPQHAAHGFELLLKSEYPEDFFAELSGAGLLDPKNNPRPQPVEGKEEFFRIPFWPALGYLTHLARIAGKKGDAQLGSELMSLVRAISGYQDDGKVVDNYHTFSALAEILGAVPTSCVTLEDVDLVKVWLSTRWNNSVIVPELDKGAMRSFLESQSDEDARKAVRLLWHCTELRESGDTERPLRTRVTVADSYWLEHLLEHHATPLGEKGRGAAIDCLLDRLRQLFSEEFISDRSWLNRAAIEPHDQNHDWDHVTNAFVDSARDALIAWLNVEPESARPYVMRMLNDDSQIVRRLAIHAVRTHWEALGAEFEAAISPLLFDVGHLHELYLLLQERYEQFSAPARGRIVELISALSNVEADSEEMVRIQHRQRNWLHAIRGKDDAGVDAEYERITKIIGPMREHPDLLSYHSTSWGTGPSPYTQDEIVAFAKDRSLISRIDSYAPPQDERSESRKSLIDGLSDAVLEHPSEFIWTLSSSEPMSRRVQYGLINGFAKVIEKGQNEAVSPSLRQLLNALLPYLDKLASDEAFWSEPAENPEAFEPNKNWIPPVLVGAVKKLVSNDSIELSGEDFDKILRIIESVKEHSKGIEMSDDPMTAAINNTRGMAVEAWLQVLLRRCRIADKEGAGNHHETWLAMRPSLEREVAGCIEGRNLESSTLLGCYLSQLLYVDEAWVPANIGGLFPFDRVSNLSCAIAGLAFANSTQRVYEVIKQADVPRLALRLDAISGSPREHLIERVALAYMWGQEHLDSPCIAEMFTSERLGDLIELAATVSRWASEKLKTDQVERAKALANKCVLFGLEDQGSRQRLLATASRFISYVKAPSDEDLDWLLPVTPFAHGSHYEDHFLEALDKIVAHDASRGLSILTKFMENYQFSYDFRGLLQSIVRKLDASGLHLDALRLVDQLVRKGGGPKWVELYRELVDGKAKKDGESASEDVPEG